MQIIELKKEVMFHGNTENSIIVTLDDARIKIVCSDKKRAEELKRQLDDTESIEVFDMRPDQ